jgi:hypothetical protein
MPLTQVQSGMMDSIAQYNSFKNRIINGAMVIDQRNAGAAVTPTSSGTYAYITDRWGIYVSQNSKLVSQQAAGVTLSGFYNALYIASSSAYSILSSDIFVLRQVIEGNNIADLLWGTASAHTVTLSFKVYSSLTGTFGGSLMNSAGDRSYPFTYSISASNTWTTISITIPGDTTGTWLTTNGIGIRVHFGLGVGSTFSGTAGAWAAAGYYSATGATSVVGTSGATFYITSVQLEKGSTATAFDYRPYELQLCQRYYEKSYDQATVPGTVSTLGMFTSIRGNGVAGTSMTFKVSKRATPTMTAYAPSSGTAGSGRDYNAGADRAVVFDAIGEGAFTISMGAAAVSSGFGVQWVSSAEL